jgi:transposase
MGFSAPGTDKKLLGAGMIQLTPQMRILLSVPAVDFRKGIDGLAGICRQVMGADPFSGGVFVFRNRRATAVKVLMYDGQGFWLCQKRLSKGSFKWWPDKDAARVSSLAVHELQILLWNGDPGSTCVTPPWKKISVADT